MKPLNEYTDRELWAEIARRKVVAISRDPSSGATSPSHARSILIDELDEERNAVREFRFEGCYADELVGSMLEGPV
jgi:hypothetical protein